MARILVYNNNTNRMEKYDRGENDSMPYNKNGTLKDVYDLNLITRHKDHKSLLTNI